MICLLAFAARNDLFALVLIGGYVTAIALLIALSRISSPVAQFLRQWSPMAYLPFCYKQVPYLITTLKLRPADLMLAHWDTVIWKVDPIFSLSLMLNRALVEFLQIVYALFIPGTILLGIMVWLRRSKQEFRVVTFQIAVTFLISYLGYILVPARGPRFMEYVAHYQPLQGLWTFHFLQRLLDAMEGVQYDCFPSGHVAMVLVGCYLAQKVSTPFFYGFAVFAACISFSTVYLRYHYVIDVIAGTALAVAVITLGPWLYRSLDSSDSSSPLPDVT
jgi:membrane-associated phospholipid phosphatase